MKKFIPLLLVLVVLNAGCSFSPSKYAISTDNVSLLRKDGASKVSVGKFTADPQKEKEINGLTMRGASFNSPYGASYPAYLQAALTDELSVAGRLGNDNKIVVSGIVLENLFDGSGINEGTASISARIKVVSSGQEKFNKIVSAEHKWESYFAAFNAVPAAQNAYVKLIQKFFNNLYSDKDFIKAIN